VKSNERFAALLGDDVAKEFVARVCDAPDEAGQLTTAEQLTVVSFFSVLGADFENAAVYERESDQMAMPSLLGMALSVPPSRVEARRVLRLAGIGDAARKSDDDAGQWRLWDSVRSAGGFAKKHLMSIARSFSVRIAPESLATWVFNLPERFHQYHEEVERRAEAGEITEDPRGMRRFFRFEYLRLLLVGWEGLAAERKAILAFIPGFLLTPSIRTQLDEAESRMASRSREYAPELWAPRERRWVRLHRAIRWLVEERWPERAPVLREIGDASAQIKFRLVHAALGNGPVLILGEPGTGKELAARAIHQLRHGEKAPYRPVNCGALSKELVRGELFGHEKGAYTGADKSRAGVFAEAENGTVFLDEIGEMPLDVQADLLRALGTGRAARLGSEQEAELNADVVAATNRELSEAIKEKGFRQDLFDRLHGESPIRLPPLHERDPDDIAAIWNRLLAKAAETARMESPEGMISRSEAAQLVQRGSKGNVRALEHLAELYVRWNRGPFAMGIGDFLERVDLSEGKSSPAEHQWPDAMSVAAARAAVAQTGSFDKVVQDFENAVIADTRAECPTLADAARRLGWKPDRLQARIRRSDAKKT
jgi:DNA-binding NtrC family response regulator